MATTGFWSRLFRGLGPLTEEPEEPLPPPEPIEEQRDGPTVAVTAQGDAFDFQLFPVLIWRTDELTREELVEWIRLCTPGMVRAVRRKAAPLARIRAPHEAQLLEDDVNRSLTGRCWRFRHLGTDLTCRARVRVVPDQQVREALQPIWRRRIEMESEHEFAIRRAELVRQRTEAWSAIIEKLQEDPLTAHAAVLTEKQFADVFKAMLQSRQDASTTLVKLLQEAVRGHHNVGLYEYAESFDAALKAFQKQAGLTDVA